MLGYDAARFIPKHSSSKKERLKINSKMTMELSDWFKGFEKGIVRSHRSNGLRSFRNVTQIV